MIIKGKSRGGHKQLVQYMMGKGENESVRLISIFGLHEQDDPYKAMKEMGRSEKLTGSTKAFYHGQISPAYEESMKLTDEQYIDITMIMAKHLGYDKPRGLITEHVKNGHKHIHVGLDRYDFKKGKLVSDSYNYYKHDDARAEAEQKYDLVRTPRRRLNKEESRNELLADWKRSATGQQFFDILKSKGLYLASSNKDRPFRIMDGKRNLNLVRELEGVTTAQVREKLAGVELKSDDLVRYEIKQQEINDQKLQKAQETSKQVTESFKDKFLKKRNKGHDYER